MYGSLKSYPRDVDSKASSRIQAGSNSAGSIYPAATSPPPPPPKKMFLKRELGLLSTTALTVNLMLGSGIFITPSSILQHTNSFGLSMVLWLAGGVITYSAALCYLELSLLVKKSGSTFVFIKEAYSFTKAKPWMEVFGSLLSFVMLWSDVLIIQPMGNAIPLLALGRYLCRPFFIDCQDMPVYAVKMFSLTAQMVLLLVNVYSVKLSARLLSWLSSLKILALAFIIILGIWKIIAQGSFPMDSQHPFEGSTTSLTQISLGLYGVVFAYDGWVAGVCVQEEAKSENTVKWMTYITTPIIIVLYLLTNASFFVVLSYDQITSAETVGLSFGEAVFGKAGLVIFCVFIAVVIFGSTHANIFVASRELFVASREGLMPQFLSGIHTSYRTPLLSVLLQVLLGGILIVIGSLDSLLNVFNAVEWFWYGCAIFGIIIMRLTRPDAPRPFKVLLLFPAAMTVVCILLVILPLWQNLVPQLVGLCVVLTGIPVYLFFVMETPCRLRPKVLDRLSEGLTFATSKIFNTEISSAFEPQK